MLASDPGEDNNVYNDSDAAVMMTKMAGLPDVSLFIILALVSLFCGFIHLFFAPDVPSMSSLWICRWGWDCSSPTSQRGWRRAEARRDHENKTQQMDGGRLLYQEEGWNKKNLYVERKNFSDVSFDLGHPWWDEIGRWMCGVSLKIFQPMPDLQFQTHFQCQASSHTWMTKFTQEMNSLSNVPSQFLR